MSGYAFRHPLHPLWNGPRALDVLASEALLGSGSFPPHLHGAPFHLVMGTRGLVKELFHRPDGHSLLSYWRGGKNFSLYIFIDF